MYKLRKEVWGGGLDGKYPIVPFENITSLYPPDQYSFFICVGYHHMNEGRKCVYAKIKDRGYQVLTYIHPTAFVQAETLGEGSLLMENVTIGPYCSVGVCNVFYPCSHVAHHTIVGEFNFFAVSCSIAGHVFIGNQCFFGNNSTTKNGITVGDKTLLGAGAYLEQDSLPGDVIVPPRAVKLEGKISSDIKL